MCYLRISMEFSHCTSGPGLSLQGLVVVLRKIIQFPCQWPVFSSRASRPLYQRTVYVPSLTQPDSGAAGVRKYGAHPVMTPVHWEPSPSVGGEVEEVFIQQDHTGSSLCVFVLCRFPGGVYLLPLLVYFPIGLLAFLLRFFIGFHVFLISCVLPKRTTIRR